MDQQLSSHRRKYFKWVDAIITDNHEYVSQTLDGSTRPYKELLLNGNLESFVKNRSTVALSLDIRFKRPFNLAAVHGSLKVCDVMIQNDVDVSLVETGSYNVVHCLVYVAFYQSQNEEGVVETYRSLCRMLSKDVMRKLLHMEESNGLRPLEFAAQQGTLQLMTAIFETPEVYVVKEEIVGISAYRWYDVTEYEMLEDKKTRHSVSPLLFLSLIDERVLDRPATRRILFEGVFGEWIKREMHCKRFSVVGYYTFRLLYLILFAFYQMDSSWLENLGRVDNDKIGNATFYSETYCNSGFAIIWPVKFLNFAKVFLFITAIFELTIEVWFIFKVQRNLIPGIKVHFLFADLNGRKSLVINTQDLLIRSFSTFGILVFCMTEIALLSTMSERGTATFIVDMMRSVSPFLYTIALSFYVQHISCISHLVICMRKILVTFIQCGFVLLVLTVAFTRLQITFFEGNSNMGCVQQFSEYYTSCTTMFLTYLNIQDYREFDVTYPAVLYFVHACYVLNIGILFYNLLIALFTDDISKVNERKRFVVTFSELMGQLQFEIAVLLLPYARGIHIKFSSFLLQRYFLTDKSRILIISKMCARRVSQGRK